MHIIILTHEQKPHSNTIVDLYRGTDDLSQGLSLPLYHLKQRLLQNLAYAQVRPSLIAIPVCTDISQAVLIVLYYCRANHEWQRRNTLFTFAN